MSDQPNQAQLTAPEVIWLQHNDSGYMGEPFPSDHSGTSWCDEEVFNCDVRYVRADIADAKLAELEARIAELERGSPRCECCGYLVHQSEHLGCIRAADKMAELVTSESAIAWVKIAEGGRAYIATGPTEGYIPVVAAQKLAELERQAAIGRRAVDDLAMLVRRLVRSLKKSDENNDLCAAAADYLRSAELGGSPLRRQIGGAKQAAELERKIALLSLPNEVLAESAQIGAVMFVDLAPALGVRGQIVGMDGGGQFAEVHFGDPAACEAQCVANLRAMERGPNRVKSVVVLKNDCAESLFGSPIKIFQTPTAPDGIIP